MPDGRPARQVPAPGDGLGKVDALLRSRETHEDLLRRDVAREQLAAGGRARSPGLLERIRVALGRR